MKEPLFSDSDVRSMLALCARVAALPAQLTTRIELVVSGIAELIEARSAFACELVAEPAEPWHFNRFLFQYGGGRWQPAVDLLETLAGSAQMPARGPLTLLGDVLPMPAGARMLTRPGYLFRSRRSVVSTRHVAGSIICVAFNRLSGEFSLRDRALVDLLFGWPWPPDILTTRLTVPWRGPRRQGEVLDLLKRGLSEKEAAVRLGLSVNTVHHHTKALHQRFGVSSRSELLSLFVR